MVHQDFITQIEAVAPVSYQESYDNSGWQLGDRLSVTTGVLLTLDVTEAIVQEAIDRNCNLIISHHPVIFPSIKKITSDHWLGRVILKAISHNISIYTAHTNMDNVAVGVNKKFSDLLKLNNVTVLSSLKGDLVKYIVYVPVTHSQHVKSAIFEAGGGNVGEYSECSFTTEGQGTFKPSISSHPAIGMAGGPRESVLEQRIEVLCPQHLLSSIIKKVASVHPYEEVAYDVINLRNENSTKGAGMVGELEKDMSVPEFLGHIKSHIHCGSIKYTKSFSKTIKKVAVCGGSGSFLMGAAMAQSCDAYITSDIKYHEFFNVEEKMMLIDIGHYETEQYTSEIFYEILNEKFPNFAVYVSKVNTNPIKYFS